MVYLHLGVSKQMSLNCGKRIPYKDYLDAMRCESKKLRQHNNPTLFLATPMRYGMCCADDPTCTQNTARLDGHRGDHMFYQRKYNYFP